MESVTEQNKLFIENELKETFSSIWDVWLKEDMFSAFAIDCQNNNVSKVYNALKDYFASKPSIQQEICLKSMINYIHSISSTQIQTFMLEILKKLTDSNIIPAKLVCEALLSSNKLSHKNSEMWCQSLNLIRNIVSYVDYKGCRDILKQLLELILSLPATDNVSTLTQIEHLYKTIEFLLDRKSSLLPSYFAVNEIVKLFSDDKPICHWRFTMLLSDFVDSFRLAAQMFTISGRCHLFPIVGHSTSNSNTWKLVPNSLKFNLNGPLPYDKDVSEPQKKLVQYVLLQPHSKDILCNMLNLNKQSKTRCISLEEEFINLIIQTMENHALESNSAQSEQEHIFLWNCISTQLIFFVLVQFFHFSHMVTSLHRQLQLLDLNSGRDYLMWALLQFISGSVQKNPLEEFLPVLSLFDFLYPEKDVLPVPNTSQASSIYALSAACIWLHMLKKAQTDPFPLRRRMPYSLSAQVECLKQILGRNEKVFDYPAALLCNAYSTNMEYFGQTLTSFVDGFYGNIQQTRILPGKVTSFFPTEPISINILNCLTVHAKMSLIHMVVTRIMKLNPKQAMVLSPAAIETYARLLTCMEIESLGIKSFISPLLPNVFNLHNWPILHGLLEMVTYRLHHIQPHYRLQLLSQLKSITQLPYSNSYQLHLCIETTALRLVSCLDNWEIHLQLSRLLSEPKSLALFANDSEEINRVMVLTLARSMHVTGCEFLSVNWCKDILTIIHQKTPHAWSKATQSFFPPAIFNFFQENPVPREDRTLFKRNVEMEYRKWKSMAGENELITHFSTPTNQPLFICVLWKSLQEDNRISPLAYKVLDKLGARAIASHLRYFVDYLVMELLPLGNQANKFVDLLSDIVWKCNIVPLDQLLLTMCLRSYEDNECQVWLLFILLLLSKSVEFKSRVNDFVKDNSPDYWKRSDWFTKHSEFHAAYPEKFFYECLPEVTQQPHNQSLPIYFSNICLRFIPVFDILIHRIIEVMHLPQISKSLENLLDQYGCLFKFHDQPLSYLYRTLHYYDRTLSDKHFIKMKLVQVISGSLNDVYASNWCLSDDYLQYLANVASSSTSQSMHAWDQSPEYFVKIVQRLVNVIDGKAIYPDVDWRFCEFPNACAHILYATSIELMALPLDANTVGKSLCNVVLRGSLHMERKKTSCWLNAVGLLLTALPDLYWLVLNELIIEALNELQLNPPTTYSPNPFLSLNFSSNQKVVSESRFLSILALCHAVWQHASIGQLSQLTSFLKDTLRPMLSTELQFLYICQLVGPFLQRFHHERTRCMLELTVELYEMLEIIDKQVEELIYIDPISDFLYHIKYMFVGDGVKTEVEKVIRCLRPALQMRLRFISHQTKEEVAQHT